MEKRVIFAVVLSALFLWLWSVLVVKPVPPSLPAIASTARAMPASLLSKPASDLPASAFFTFPAAKTEIIFSRPQAAVKEAIFPDYQSEKFNLAYAFLLEGENLTFQQQPAAKDRVVFRHLDQNKEIIKRFIFSNTSYDIGLEIEVRNLTSQPLTLSLPIVLGELNFQQHPEAARFWDVLISQKDKTGRYNGRKEIEFSAVKFIGLRDQYFSVILDPLEDNASAFIKKIDAQHSSVSLVTPEFVLLPQQAKTLAFRIYLGPQELRILNALNPDWTNIMHYGTFDFISQLLLQLLEFFYRLVHNWGTAIVLLSLAIYLFLFPLSLKQMRSMKQMQVIQPKVEALRNLYKSNPQRLNKEIMELYRQNKVNPLGGCLPIVIQIPIFFALYQALIRAIALKGANFLWIKDLSAPDRLFILPASLPIIGKEINLLPLLMTAGMFLQQKWSTVSTASSAQQQKMMLVLFPLMFGLIFYRMPAGLVLYWFINSMLMLVYQYRMHKAK